jgi:predicted small metal-binding protein
LKRVGAPPRAAGRVIPASTLEAGVAYRINCTCGHVINGDDEEELYRDAEEHMTVLHPELVDNVAREDILAQAEML